MSDNADMRVNIRLSQEEYQLLQEVLEILEARRVQLVESGSYPKGTRLANTSQRMAIVEALRFYLPKLKEMVRKR